MAVSVIRQIQLIVGNATEEIGPQIAKIVALQFGLNVWQSAALTFSELVTIGRTHKLSVTQLTKILQSIVNLRPEWRGKVFPTQIKKGLLREIKNENTTSIEEPSHVELVQAEQADSPFVQAEQEEWS